MFMARTVRGSLSANPSHTSEPLFQLFLTDVEGTVSPRLHGLNTYAISSQNSDSVAAVRGSHAVCGSKFNNPPLP